MLGSEEGLYLFALYSIFIIGIVYFLKEKLPSTDDFLLMQRKLGAFQGSLSMAVSWIWAPAIFIVSLQAYNQGLPGVFWFTAPNILCFFVFIPIALKLREVLPEGYTISQLFLYKFPDSRLPHNAAMIVVFGYQLGAIIINCVAGGTLIHLLSGIPYMIGVLLMATVALYYSLISGLRASVVTDVVQMIMILVIGALLVPLAIIKAGGFSTLVPGLSGVSGEYGNVFDPEVAYFFGIAMTIGLISGPIADQMFSQRAFAADKNAVKNIFLYGGLLFGIVPITLSLLGFLGAAATQSGELIISDPQMVGPEVINHFLPKWALMLFSIMAFAALSSTLDSAFCAIASLTAIDLASRNSSLIFLDKTFVARAGMVFFAVLGTGIALLQPKLLWVFLVYGALAASIFIPVFLALFWNKLTANGAFLGILGGVIIGTPLSIYANINELKHLVVISSLAGLLLSGALAVVVSSLERAKA